MLTTEEHAALLRSLAVDRLLQLVTLEAKRRHDGHVTIVALVCAQADAPPGALESRVAQMLANLKRLTRARRTAPPLAPFPVKCLAHETPAHLDQSEAVFQALAQFLQDSLAAERVTLAGAVRIVLNLLADLCAMLTHQYGHTAAEVEARIDRLSGPLRSQITAYHRQRDQGGERPSPC